MVDVRDDCVRRSRCPGGGVALVLYLAVCGPPPPSCPIDSTIPCLTAVRRHIYQLSHTSAYTENILPDNYAQPTQAAIPSELLRQTKLESVLFAL